MLSTILEKSLTVKSSYDYINWVRQWKKHHKKAREAIILLKKKCRYEVNQHKYQNIMCEYRLIMTQYYEVRDVMKQKLHDDVFFKSN